MKDFKRSFCTQYSVIKLVVSPRLHKGHTFSARVYLHQACCVRVARYYGFHWSQWYYSDQAFCVLCVSSWEWVSDPLLPVACCFLVTSLLGVNIPNIISQHAKRNTHLAHAWCEWILIVVFIFYGEWEGVEKRLYKGLIQIMDKQGYKTQMYIQYFYISHESSFYSFIWN